MPIYERASAIFRDSLPADNYQRALPLLSLASIYLDQGRPAEAEATSREALDLLSIALPEGHAVTAVAECRVARSLAARGRTTEALPHFNLAAEVLTDENHFVKYRTECLSAAAASFASLGDEGRAEELRALAGDAEQPLEP